MLERLQKIIARAGIASRRHAEELIRSGQVTVNGVVVTELGAKADPDVDKVEAAGRTAEQPTAAGYYILNKPPHVVSTMSDPEGRATLRHVLRGLSGGVFPVGRLDYAASGLILLTTDGKLADSLFKVSSGLVQVNWVKVKGRPSAETLSKVTHQARARVRKLPAPDAAGSHAENPWYEAEMRGAKRDLVREAFFALGHPVEKMKRVRLGPLDIGDLPEGQYRQLATSEVEALRHAVEQAMKQGSEQAALQGPARPAVRAFERKKWTKRDATRPPQQVQDGGSQSFTRGPKSPFRQGGERAGQGFRPGPKRPFQPGGSRPDRDRFRPAAKGAPHRGSSGPPPGTRTGPRPGPPRTFEPDEEQKFPPRDFRPGGPKHFPPRSEQGSGGSFNRGGRPGERGPSGPRSGPPRSFTPGGGRKFPRSFGPGSEKKFPPRGEQSGPGGFSRGGGPGERGPSGPRSGPPRNFTPGGGRKFPPRSFGTGGEKKFPPRGERSGAGGTPWRGDRPSGPPRGDRPSGPPRGERRSGPGKFAPRGARPGAPGAGKFQGKRPSGRPPGRPGSRPGGRPSGRPGGRPNRPPR